MSVRFGMVCLSIGRWGGGWGGRHRCGAPRIQPVQQRLGPLGVVPDVGAFQFAVYFFETFDFAVKVKDTPSANRRAHAGHRFADGRD